MVLDGWGELLYGPVGPTQTRVSQHATLVMEDVKELVHPKKNICPSFTHPQRFYFALPSVRMGVGGYFCSTVK